MTELLPQPTPTEEERAAAADAFVALFDWEALEWITNVVWALTQVVMDLQAQGHIPQPTKMEQILQLLYQHWPILPMEALTPLFVGTYDPVQSARNMITKLNEKLVKYNLRLAHVTAYQLRFVPLTTEDSVAK
jgi:hypothetical protein